MLGIIWYTRRQLYDHVRAMLLALFSNIRSQLGPVYTERFSFQNAYVSTRFHVPSTRICTKKRIVFNTLPISGAFRERIDSKMDPCGQALNSIARISLKVFTQVITEVYQTMQQHEVYQTMQQHEVYQTMNFPCTKRHQLHYLFCGIGWWYLFDVLSLLYHLFNFLFGCANTSVQLSI